MVQKAAFDKVSALQDIAGPGIFEQNKQPIEAGLGLLGYGVTKDAKKALDTANSLPDSPAKAAAVATAQKQLADAQAQQQDLKNKSEKAMAVLSGNKFRGFLAAINQGIEGNIAGVNFRLGAPIETYIRNSFSKDEGMQDYTINLAQSLANAAVVGKQLGVNYSADMNSSPRAAMASLMHLYTALHSSQTKLNFVQSVAGGAHPAYTSQGSATSFADALNSPELKKELKQWEDQHQEIDSNYRKGK